MSPANGTDTVTYTDWRKDNYFYAVQRHTKGARRLGIEFDHVSLDLKRQLEEALPGVEFVDIGQPSMWMRTIKSAEEIALIKEGARICDIGGEARGLVHHGAAGDEQVGDELLAGHAGRPLHGAAVR